MANMETELKLSCPAERIGEVLDHPVMRSPGGRKPVSRHQISTYYDTADNALAKAGLSLRLRSAGRQHWQTVKTKGSERGGLHARGEWEARVATPLPDIALLEHWGLAEDFAAIIGERPLFPRVVTDIRRATRRVTTPTGVVEIAVDRGEVRAEEASEPIAEIELELIEGEVGALYDLALRLAETLPLALGSESKAARGFRLLGLGEPPQAARAEAIPLDGAMPAEEAFWHIGRSCLDHVAANAPALIAASDDDAVHQMRIGIRRLRSAMTTFKAMIASEDTEAVKEDLRWLMGLLAPARDSEVFLAESLAPLAAAALAQSKTTALPPAESSPSAQGERPPMPEDGAGAPGWAGLRDHFETESLAHQRAAREAVASPRFALLVLRATRWLDGGDWRGADERSAARTTPLGKAAAAVLRKRHKALRRAGRDFEDLSPEARHALRVHIKKLRYALEFLSDLYPEKPTRATLRVLKEAQEILGTAHDIVVAREKLRRAAASAGPGNPDLAFTAGWAAALNEDRQATLETAGRKAWEAVKAMDKVWKS
ncbi:inorganic triphosphatase [Rhodospirillum rubrum]|uniref:CYTH and CHAD domain-containing protein n=1 Tax=Rhodospirillum rubrum TaxID=1085 RepID=UPI001905C9FE|nr:CYTH and CHAD domain-containing protein [Rhodospirillum rubrum]MBK1663599.1 inorganic triphosphatase [Rhodospirillum rubrum]MBK1675938.1 inorganic triphosphatase [Rhodospirillum rubrum]